jgi:hypothetical protein
MMRDGVASAMASLEGRDLDFLEQMSGDARIELYIPPPPMATREEALRYHIATRNFFAWVFRRSLVGEHLGTSMINLLNSMMGFRRPGESNMDDLMAYIDEEGYLDMRNQPIHALAVLHFAEYFQTKKLYINAFTHCVGMYDELFTIPEYQASFLLRHLFKTQLTVDAGCHFCYKEARAARQVRDGSEACPCGPNASKPTRRRAVGNAHWIVVRLSGAPRPVSDVSARIFYHQVRLLPSTVD